MEALSTINAWIGRWLAYADLCISTDEPLGRCQAFWGFLAALIGIVCLAALVTVMVKLFCGQAKGTGTRGDAKYRKAP